VVAGEFLGKSAEAPGVAVLLKGYLAVEVALYPRGDVVAVKSGDFRLRVNGKVERGPSGGKEVAHAVLHPEMHQMAPYRGPVVTGGVGPAVVVVGGPKTRERFPGDPQAKTPPKVPTGAPEPPSDKRDVGEKDAEAVQKVELEAVTTATPVAGLLYFAWEGTTKYVKTVELLYDGPLGQAVLRLR